MGGGMFEWDAEKSEATLEKRGFDFEYAARILRGATLEWCDTRTKWGEIRVVAVGLIESRHYTVIYTPRGSVRRIISARRARKEEVRGYQAGFS